MFARKDEKKVSTKKHHRSGMTLIANNCEVLGDIIFIDQLQIDGVVKGNIHSLSGTTSQVTVSKKGVVKGVIRAPRVIVNGEVLGDIHATEHLELAAKARVKGNVHYKHIEIVKGAIVDGQLVYSHDDKLTTEQQADERPARILDAPRQEMPETAKITPLR